MFNHFHRWFYLLCVFSIPCYACLWIKNHVGSNVDHIKLFIDKGQAVNVVNKRFLSVAIDTSEVQKQWSQGKLNFSSPQLQTLSTALSPSYLRLGGTSADFLIYSNGGLHGTKHKDFTNFTMSDADWDDINKFSTQVGWQLIFDVNVLLRTGQQWDDTNFRKLLEYNAKQGYILYWELGNEPNAFEDGKVTNTTVTSKQLAQDYRHLRSLLDASVKYRHNFIMGPSVTCPRIGRRPTHGLSEHSQIFMDEFYQNGGGEVINATTWHQYYMDGRIATDDNFTDPDLLDSLIREIQTMNEVVYKYNPSAKIWLGETSSTYGGGTKGLSNAYASGFMWLDKLCIAALYGIDTVIRQTLYGGSYSLLTSELDPLPDYWLSLLYKRLVGQKVLNVTSSAHGRDTNLRLIRAYAHCTLPSSEYTKGDVTVVLLNLDKTRSKNVAIEQFKDLKGIGQYLLTPHGNGDIRSQIVDLNGKKLKMIDERTLPALLPKTLSPTDGILLPPLSFGFYVMKGAKASVCL
ncbi:heparanase-like [Antedon mediterranea]|uniref:heparanase-like n=1 Tax=Antedon mediterranea TaxID=105859 RepID=UPI003AF99DC8